MNKKKNNLISLMTIWGVILVLIGHSGFQEEDVLTHLYWLNDWVYSFHMPLFFFISGYLCSLTNKDYKSIQPSVFIWKKFKRLLVPYFILGVIIFCIKYLFSSLSYASDREFSFLNFFTMFVSPHHPGSTLGYLWYLWDLFLVFLFFILLSRFVSLRSVVKTVSLSVLLWCGAFCLSEVITFDLNRLLWFTPFFLLGQLVQPYTESLQAMYNSRAGGLKLIIYLFISCAVFYNCENEVVSFFIKIVLATNGILLSATLCSIVLNFNKHTHILSLARMTYSIYLLQWFGQYISKYIMVDFFKTPWWSVFSCMFIGGLLFSFLVVICFDRIRFLRENKFLCLVVGYSPAKDRM